jgi:hypothetical protein
MVQLASYLVADSVESYRVDHVDGDNVEAVFDPPELDQGLAFRKSIPKDLAVLLQQWALGFCPLNAIERSLSDLIDARASSNVERVSSVITAQEAIAMLEPGDIMIDCAHRCSWSAIRRSAPPTSSRFRSASSARCFWPASSDDATCR